MLYLVTFPPPVLHPQFGLSYPMGIAALVFPFGAVADQLMYPFGSLQRRNDTQEGRVCTACGRNNSPEWRKVSSPSHYPHYPHPLFPPIPFPISGCPCIASPRFGPSSAKGSVGRVPGLAVTATPAGPHYSCESPLPSHVHLFRWPTRCVGRALAKLALGLTIALRSCQCQFAPPLASGQSY